MNGLILLFILLVKKLVGINEKDSTENLKAFKKIFNNLKNDAINGKKFEIKDNTLLDARKPLNKSLFNKLRKKHKV